MSGSANGGNASSGGRASLQSAVTANPEASPSGDDLSPRNRDVLLVDDSEAFRERLALAFRDRGLSVRTAANYDEAVALARQSAPAMAVVDLRMPGRSGLELVRDLKKLDPATRVLVLTGFGSIATAVEAVKLGAVNYLSKPADADDILAALSRGEASDSGSPSPSAEAPSLARAEWEHINRILTDCKGNISEAARRLGIHRRSLQRKLRKRAPD